MATVASPTASTVPQIRLSCFKYTAAVHRLVVPFTRTRCIHVCCTSLTPWEPAPVKYAPAHDVGDGFLKGTANVFETLKSEGTSESSTISTDGVTDVRNLPTVQLQFLKWPMWLLGPSILLATSMVPTLWLPLSSIFLGPNIASLLSLIGLDCIFNLGATLFLLMADSCAQPRNPLEDCDSKAPYCYRLWNIVATITGFFIPVALLLGSQKGFLQPQLPFLSYAILLGPYLLLLAVQMLTEMLTWHWKSPVWLVTPVVYEAYRVLQLLRGLKLSTELSSPGWVEHTIRGLVCWWVLILGRQLMRVAWFAGVAATAHGQKSSSAATGA